MTNEEKYFKTMEALHDFEPPPFNPISPEVAEKIQLHNSVMNKAKTILESFPLTEEEKDAIDDRIFVRSCAALNMYSYSVSEDGSIIHPSPQGMELIRRTACHKLQDTQSYIKALKRFVKF